MVNSFVVNFYENIQVKRESWILGVRNSFNFRKILVSAPSTNSWRSCISALTSASRLNLQGCLGLVDIPMQEVMVWRFRYQTEEDHEEDIRNEAHVPEHLHGQIRTHCIAQEHTNGRRIHVHGYLKTWPQIWFYQIEIFIWVKRNVS